MRKVGTNYYYHPSFTENTQNKQLGQLRKAAQLEPGSINLKASLSTTISHKLNYKHLSEAKLEKYDQ